MNLEDSATKKDLEGLQGTWRLISAMEDGKSLAEDKVKQTTIVIKDDTFRFPHLAEDATSKAGTIKLRDEKAEADGHSLDRERGHARHLRAGRRRLQGLLRAGRQGTSQRIHFEVRKWQHPPSLGAG